MVSSRRLLAVKGLSNQSQFRDSIRLNMDELRESYPSKERIVLLYQYPAMQFTQLFDIDPLQHLKELERKYLKEDTLLVGVSHQHPRFLKQVQVTLN